MTSINFEGDQYWLTSISNCDSINRYESWMRHVPSALNNNKSIGCGLNALTFLGFFTIDQGTALVKVISRRGTSFQEMVNLAWNSTVMPQRNPIRGISHDISTLKSATDFINTLNQLLPDNHCTVAKLMRYPDDTPDANVPLCRGSLLTSGHSIVFAKTNNTIYAIDPQQGSNRKHNMEKAFKSWKDNCYTFIYLMFSRVPNPIPVPMDVDEDIEHVPLSVLPDHGEPMDVDDSDSENRMDVVGGKKTRRSKRTRRSTRTRRSRRTRRSKKR